MSRRRAFLVVDEFERALCEFTGAPYAVAVDSCTNALYLALEWYKRSDPGASKVVLPSHTYVGVVQAARNAGYDVAFADVEWRGSYQLVGTDIIDSAKRFERGMWYGRYKTSQFICVSFQAGKLLPIGRGGAILHDNPEADEWFCRARLDGRTAGADYQDNTYQGFGAHCYMLPEHAARGLHLLTYLEDDDDGSWREYPDLAEATWV